MTKKILFLHPDLGIGGAERLVVDAALALKNKGHSVSFVTTHHDPNHCFDETKDGSFPVTVVGDWIPRHIFGKLYALLAYVRMIYAALYIVFFSKADPDIVFCDIVSVCIPFLKLGNSTVLYYCHFPDQLLSSPGNFLKQIYRRPLNWLEEITTNSADIVLVNSKFTQTVFKDTFKSIFREPSILYPSINTDFFDKNSSQKPELSDVLPGGLPYAKYVFLSINRFERKKNITLAINALNYLLGQVPTGLWDQVFLIIAGGYDDRVNENVEYYEELKQLVGKKLEYKVYFVKSPSDLEKLTLLSECDCLIYTPSNEHFGIVPLEAMYSKKPVIAVNSGGPTETIVHEVTGYLCNSNHIEFAKTMRKCLEDRRMSKELGLAGRTRFEEKFSFNAFQNNLNSIIENLDVPNSGKID